MSFFIKWFGKRLYKPGLRKASEKLQKWVSKRVEKSKQSKKQLRENSWSPRTKGQSQEGDLWKRREPLWRMKRKSAGNGRTTQNKALEGKLRETFLYKLLQFVESHLYISLKVHNISLGLGHGLWTDAKSLSFIFQSFWCVFALDHSLVAQHLFNQVLDAHEMKDHTLPLQKLHLAKTKTGSF